MLSSIFYRQLRHYIGNTVTVATGSDLFEGVLHAVTDEIIRITESAPGYENNLDIITIPLDKIKYVRVDNAQ
ncbi:hypothetical protein [Peribacillus sp. NPDC097895]|uniref:hypothetical protein n=1 Tax=Peribacillus sp. NPDC097895 TaxID=3390619 RepID=UPI003D039C15